ncbi:hypothetical protein AXF42_Ash016716 [Apostasia shenzhenica]|uniref:Uncharacterized protein n=1 Tax=Apostasia shenzhenica TaxID=1088818 RepID=A0A2I0AQ39_9ASPA|nr:hypothetical protein AXF42_Ash016716 [Apostasia shenzhenica]
MNIHLREVICTSKVNQFMPDTVRSPLSPLKVLIQFWMDCRKETGFGGYLSVIYAGTLSNTLEFQVNLIRKPFLQIATYVVFCKYFNDSNKNQSYKYVSDHMKLRPNLRNWNAISRVICGPPVKIQLPHTAYVKRGLPPLKFDQTKFLSSASNYWVLLANRGPPHQQHQIKLINDVVFYY